MCAKVIVRCWKWRKDGHDAVVAVFAIVYFLSDGVVRPSIDLGTEK